MAACIQIVEGSWFRVPADLEVEPASQARCS